MLTRGIGVSLSVEAIQARWEELKRMRSAVERFFAWLTAFRRITIRYERLALTFLASYK
ncbi:MAG: hypothetical protein QXI39_04380 [Candidatus Bathyarchaeia archaeon]